MRTFTPKETYEIITTPFSKPLAFDISLNLPYRKQTEFKGKQREEQAELLPTPIESPKKENTYEHSITDKDLGKAITLLKIGKKITIRG